MAFSLQTIAQQKTHVVKPGETFYHIAVVEYGVTMEELRKANPWVGTKYSIAIGQELIIPEKSKGGTATTPAPAAEKPVAKTAKPAPANIAPVVEKKAAPPAKITETESAPTGYHIVKAGETINSIASDFGVTGDNIKKWNVLPQGLKAGMKILVVDPNDVPAEVVTTKVEKPAKTKEAPVVQAEKPVKTEKPAKTQEAPVVQTEKPVIKSEKPVINTEKPVIEEEQTVVTTTAPVVQQEKTVTQKQAPVVQTEKPILDDDAPSAPTAKPVAQSGTSGTQCGEKPILDDEPSSSSAPVATSSGTSAPVASTTTYNNVGTQVPSQPDKYRRSSLYTLLVPGGSTEYGDAIESAYISAPLPAKFNDHNLPNRIAPRGLTDEKSVTKFLEENHIARAMVAKWFNRSAKGGFSMDLIAQRGAYDATQIDVNVAKSSQRGMALLSDAGEELIGNTFIMVTYFKYTKIDEVAKGVGTGVSIFASIVGAATGVNLSAVSTAATVATSMMDGYGVQAHTFLYRLNWNDQIASTFYNQYWMDDAHYDAARKAAFDNSEIFSLQYVGMDKAGQPMMTSKFDKRSKKEQIKDATLLAAHKVIVVLQRKHQEFRTKTPIYSVNPIMAKVGMKEGLGPKEKNPKFEVLEKVIDSNGKTQYKRVAVIKVDKGHIWDNRYVLTEDSDPGGTYFSGGGRDVAPGMLIKQID